MSTPGIIEAFDIIERIGPANPGRFKRTLFVKIGNVFEDGCTSVTVGV